LAATFNSSRKASESIEVTSKDELRGVEKIPKKAKKHFAKGRTKLKINVSSCKYEVVRDVVRDYFRMRLIEDE
jgi:hypothetical protein